MLVAEEAVEIRLEKIGQEHSRDREDARRVAQRQLLA